MQSFYVTLVLFMFGQIGQSCKLRSLGTIELSNRRRVCGASFITDKSLVANTLEWMDRRCHLANKYEARSLS